jgi:hypothetical protein
MSSITSDKSEKVAFIVLNVFLALAWLHFLIRLITRWDAMTPNIRADVGLFMMFFSFWWLMLIREKKGVISLLMAGGVFMTVVEIVRTFM